MKLETYKQSEQKEVQEGEHGVDRNLESRDFRTEAERTMELLGSIQEKQELLLSLLESTGREAQENAVSPEQKQSCLSVCEKIINHIKHEKEHFSQGLERARDYVLKTAEGFKADPKTQAWLTMHDVVMNTQFLALTAVNQPVSAEVISQIIEHPLIGAIDMVDDLIWTPLVDPAKSAVKKILTAAKSAVGLA